MSLNRALKHPDPAWAFFHCLTDHDLWLMDELLVKANHPLAMMPGTKWSRFKKLWSDGYQFANPLQ